MLKRHFTELWAELEVSLQESHGGFSLGILIIECTSELCSSAPAVRSKIVSQTVSVLYINRTSSLILVLFQVLVSRSFPYRGVNASRVFSPSISNDWACRIPQGLKSFVMRFEKATGSVRRGVRRAGTLD